MWEKFHCYDTDVPENFKKYKTNIYKFIMGTKKDVFTINQIKDILQIQEQSITNIFSSTLERMDKKVSYLIGENVVLKN